MAAWVGQPVVLVCYALVAFGFLSGVPVIITSVLWSVFLSAALACWLYCQLADPSVAVEHRLLPRQEHEARYCAVCKKVVPGIDHHCVWLNTCVGARSYFAFFCLVLFSALTYSWQIVSMALLLTTWWTPDVQARGAQVFGSSNGLFAVAIVNIVLALPAAFFHICLFIFHVYLQATGATTYGWKMQMAEATRARRKRARERQQQEQQQEHEAPSPVKSVREDSVTVV